MGGQGSTRWGLHRRKRRVEDCLTLNAVDLGRGVVDWSLLTTGGGQAGQIVWRQNHRPVGAVNYRLDGKRRLLTLSYFVVGRPREMRLALVMVNGRRWVFECPVCHRRADCLYCPPSARWFWCRKCHDLAYTSAQTAHSLDRGYARRSPVGLIARGQGHI
jgi:hypothetical protein